MLVAAERIRRNLPSSRSGRDDEIIQAAIIRWVEIFGEAANHVHPEVQRAHPEVSWRKIVGMRNRIVHSYFEVDLEVAVGCP